MPRVRLLTRATIAAGASLLNPTVKIVEYPSSKYLRHFGTAHKAATPYGERKLTMPRTCPYSRSFRARLRVNILDAGFTPARRTSGYERKFTYTKYGESSPGLDSASHDAMYAFRHELRRWLTPESLYRVKARSFVRSVGVLREELFSDPDVLLCGVKSASRMFTPQTGTEYLE